MEAAGHRGILRNGGKTRVNERCAAVLERINTQLSPLERGSLLASLEGHTAAQTAQLLHCTPKAVENALMRARKKLRSDEVRE